MKKVTIRDIAKKASVSVATVSNVLNGVDKCKAETKKRVLDVVSELGYRPNISAKTLATRRSGLIGLVTHDRNTRLNLSQMNILINGMNSAIRKYENYDLIITEIFKDGNNDFLRDWIVKRDLEGVIFLGDYEEELLKGIEKTSVPMVMVDSYGDELQKASYIYSEDTLGSYLAVEHLIERGSRNIAFICGSLEENEVHRRRFYGYKAAVEEYGLRLLEENIFETDETFASGYDITESIVKREDIDSIFFAYSEGAFGSLKYLNKAKVKIPDKISIIAFGDVEAWNYTIPSLSSVDQQVEYKGRLAIDMMIDKISGKKKYNREVSIPIKIIERETT